MAYKKGVKRVFKKKSYVKKRGVRRVSRKSSLISLIKKVSLKNVETKSTHTIHENVNINHNTGYIYTNLLKTSQGITDTDTGTSAYANRIGDELLARGISIKLWIANKLDRPNVMYRIGVFKYQAASVPTLSQIFTGANGNRMMDNLDKEFITVVYQKIINLQTGVSGTLPIGSDATKWAQKEAHKYLKLWIPLKNKKILYNNSGSVPKFIDYGFFIVPYDSYGTLTTDTIASFAYEQQFYFKDA